MTPLTEIQQKICWCMMQGYTIKETAFIVKRSVPTVKKHRRIIIKSIGDPKRYLLQPKLLSNFIKVLPQIDTLNLVVFTTDGKNCANNDNDGSKSSGSDIKTQGAGNTERIK